MPKNKVLLPLDDVEFTLQIVPYILRYLAPEENDLILLYIPDQLAARPSKQPYLQFPTLYNDQTDTSVQAHFMHEVQPYMDALQQAGFTIFTRVAFDEPRQAIEQSIQQESINLVVMATAAQPADEQIASTGTAQQVIQHTTVPVMLYNAINL